MLCTDKPSARTRARGTAIIVDSSGAVLTAAHVVSESLSSCTLTVVVPHGEWTRPLGFRTFSVGQCVSDQLLDIALCRIQPLGDKPDRSYLQPAILRLQIPSPNSWVTITGFTGWGFFPTVVRGHLASPAQFYRRQDGCYCDFAVDAVTSGGMSGSPVVTDHGEVVGLITTSGTGQFRGLSFGTSLERAAPFLRKAGLASLVP